MRYDLHGTSDVRLEAFGYVMDEPVAVDVDTDSQVNLNGHVREVCRSMSAAEGKTLEGSVALWCLFSL